MEQYPNNLNPSMGQQQSNVAAIPSTIVAKEGWSWGAFVKGPAFLVGAKQYKILLYYLIMFLAIFIPFINFLVPIAFLVMSIYLGVKGHKIAAEGKHFINQSEYDGFIKGIDHIGKIAFYIGLVFILLIIVFLIVGLSLSLFVPKFIHR